MLEKLLCGYYHLFGYTIRVTKPKDEYLRTRRHFKRMREQGRCVQCGVTISDINPNTNKPYVKCPKHLKEQNEAARKKREQLRYRSTTKRITKTHKKEVLEFLKRFECGVHINNIIIYLESVGLYVDKQNLAHCLGKWIRKGDWPVVRVESGVYEFKK